MTGGLSPRSREKSATTAPVPPVPPPGLLNMQPTATEYESTAAGTEYLIRLQTDDTPPQEWCRYEFTEPGGRRFLVTAPTVEDCRIFRNLWLNELAERMR